MAERCDRDLIYRDGQYWMRGGSDEKNAYQMILKSIPDNEFMDFFEDNPEMTYVTVLAEYDREKVRRLRAGGE